MRTILVAIAVAAALLMIGVSTAMNFLFMKSLAPTDAEGVVLGSASAAADLIKACLPWFIALAWRGRRFVFAVLGGLVFVGFSLFSFASALGFAADIRGSLAGSREAASHALDAIDAKIKTATVSRITLGSPRAVSIIDAERAVLHQDRRYTTSEACQKATATSSRSLCTKLAELAVERAKSVEAVDIDKTLQSLERQAAVQKSRGAGGESDPQVSVIARLLSQERGAVKIGLIIAAALLVELGSGLGLWLAVGHSDRVRPSKRDPSHTVSHVSPERISTTTSKPMIAAAMPPAHSLAYGDVLDFCVARLQPSSRGGLTLLGLYRGYETWCQERKLQTLGQDEFGAAFEILREAWGIETDGDRYPGIRVGIV